MATENTLSQVRQKLSHMTMAHEPALYLDTKIPDLNSVLGHRDLGIPYGRITEIYGTESVGKSALCMSIAALAQHDGAYVIWGDIENSWNGDWAVQRGIAPCPKCNGKCFDETGDACKICEGIGCDPEKICVVCPFVGKFGKEKEARLSYAEEVLEEIEGVWDLKAKKHKKILIFLDSIEALLPQAEAEAGIGGKRRMGSKAVLVGELLRRWLGLAQARNTHLYCINQMREDPGNRFGSPWYTTGGNSLRFYCHFRVRVQRITGSRIITGGKTVGIRGKLKCDKNKGGGVEGSVVGYHLMYDGPVKFMSEKELNKEAKIED